MKLVPISLMLARAAKAKEESDTAYFFDLLLFAEFAEKLIVSAIVAGIENDKTRARYSQLHRLVRADGIGEWQSVLDETMTGVSSQFLNKSIVYNEQKELQIKSIKGTWQFDCVFFLNEVLEKVGLQKMQLSDKVQARIWFVLFSQLRNGTKGHGAILPFSCSEACILLEKSINLLIENFYLFKREWVYLYQNLNGKYRVTNLNDSVKEFDELKVSSNYASQYSNGVYVFFEKRTLVEFLYSNPEADDFYLPNGNFRQKNFELLSYVSNQRMQGDSSMYLVPANELPESETHSLGSLEVQGKSFGNIPPLPKEYIIRQSLEDDLNKILNEADRYPIITLVGRGGIGKTTLALSVLHNINSTDRFDLMLWFSSRDIDLMLEGPKPVKNEILSEFDIADQFVKLVGENIEKKQEKINFLGAQMSKSTYGKILFVLDNFETVQNPAELFQWIDTYIRNPNKVLITSRISKSFKADYPIEIYGMTEVECHELINVTSESFGITGLISEEIRNDIIEESQGHPYIIKILLGQIAKTGKPSKIERIMASQEDILIALFRRTYNTLTPAAKRVFLTLCSWRSIVPQIALEAVLLRADIKDRINVEDAVEELRKSSFIDLIDTDDDSFISVPLAAFLFGKSELEVSPMKIAILADRELLQEFGVTQQADVQRGILPRIERKFRAIANRITRYSESIEEHLPMLEYLARKHPYAWNFLSQLHVENGNHSKAQEALREYLKTPLNVEERKYTLYRIANLYKLSEDWFAEVNALTELSLMPNATLEEISDSANIINRYLFKESEAAKLELDSDIKENLVNKFAELMSSKINSSATATDFSRLAWLYMHLKNFDKAQEAVLSGLKKDSNNPYIYRLALKFNMI